MKHLKLKNLIFSLKNKIQSLILERTKFQEENQRLQEKIVDLNKITEWQKNHIQSLETTHRTVKDIITQLANKLQSLENLLMSPSHLHISKTLVEEENKQSCLASSPTRKTKSVVIPNDNTQNLELLFEDSNIGLFIEDEN